MQIMVIGTCFALGDWTQSYVLISNIYSSSSVYNDEYLDSEQKSSHSVNSEAPSVGTLADAASTEEIHFPHLVSDHRMNARKSDEPRVQSQPRSTYTNKMSTAKHIAPLSIYGDHVFRRTSSQTKFYLHKHEHATVLQRNLNHSLINCVHIITANKRDVEECLSGLDLLDRHN